MEPDPIDHKDKPGELRDRVRASIFQRVAAVGALVVSSEQLTGTWHVDFIGIRGESIGKRYVLRLQPDGQAISEYPGRLPSDRDRWKLNDDGSFSRWAWCEAMPKYGIHEPTMEETRMHAAVLEDGRVVLWNGDGSLVKLLSR
jgi:hypothetical protein